MSVVQGACHIKNRVAVIFRYIHCFHLMSFEVDGVLVSSGTQIQPQITLDPYYLPDCLSVSYDYGNGEIIW